MILFKFHSSEEKETTGIRKIVQPNMSSLRNATIQAMSNLLSANIDSGLMHSIGLGYNKDLQTRAAFMEVLTKILQQGTEFDTLAENVLGMVPHKMSLITILGHKHFKQKFVIFYEKNSTASDFGSYLISNFIF